MAHFFACYVVVMASSRPLWRVTPTFTTSLDEVRLGPGCFNEIVSPASLHGVSLMLSQNISPPPTSVRNKSTQIMANPMVCCYLRPSNNRIGGGLGNVTSDSFYKVHYGKNSIEVGFINNISFFLCIIRRIDMILFQRME